MDGIKTIGVVYSPTQEAQSFATMVANRLDLRGPSWVCRVSDEDSFGQWLEQTDVLITVGGDGTILRVARAAAPYGVPILGINLGRIGFMTELQAHEALAGVAWYLYGEMAWIEERAMLQATIIIDSQEHGRKEQIFHALNDVVVARGDVPRLIHIAAQVNDTPLTTYYADALIISTATGSTGYALAAGGPILHALSQDNLVMPVAPHVSLSAALVLPSDAIITLSVETPAPAMVSVDGLREIAIAPGDVVRVSRSPYVTRFLRARDPRYFYATLIQRLGLIPGAQVMPDVEGHEKN